MKPQYYFYILLFLFLPMGLQAQQWEEVIVPNTVNNIKNLIVSPNADIVMTTGDSIIHCSFDGCQTWEELPYPQWDENQYPEFYVFPNSLTIDIQNALYISTRYKKGDGFSKMLLKSVDTARTWYKVHEDTTGIEGFGQIVYSNNDGVMFMNGGLENPSFRYGLFRSLDYGESWHFLYTTPESSAGSHNYVTDIEMNDSGETYISMVGHIMPNSGVYYSTDTANNISLIETLAGYDVYGLAKNSQEDIFTACWDHYINPPGGVFVKYNQSNDWVWLNQHLSLRNIVINSKDYIYVANGSLNIGVFVSYDNGITFEKMSNGLPNFPIDGPKKLLLDKDEYLYAFLYDTDDSRIYKTKHSTIATQDIIDSNPAITHYPNPVHDVLHIVMPEHQHTAYKVQIYDMQGRLQHQEVTATLNIQVSQLSAGLYTYTIQAENHFFTNTFVKH